MKDAIGVTLMVLMFAAFAVVFTGCTTSGVYYETRSESFDTDGNVVTVDYEIISRDTRELWSDIADAAFNSSIVVTDTGYTVELGQRERGIQSSEALTDIGRIIGDLVSIVPQAALPELAAAFRSGALNFIETPDGYEMTTALSPELSALASLITSDELAILVRALQAGELSFGPPAETEKLTEIKNWSERSESDGGEYGDPDSD